MELLSGNGLGTTVKIKIPLTLAIIPGLVIVDRIIDIVHEEISVRQSVAGPGLLGSAVIGKHVTDLLDVSHIVQTSDEPSMDESNSGDLEALAHSTHAFNTSDRAVPVAFMRSAAQTINI